MPELTINSPMSTPDSRVASNTFTMGTLCQSRLYPPVRDFGFGLCKPVLKLDFTAHSKMEYFSEFGPCFTLKWILPPEMASLVLLCRWYTTWGPLTWAWPWIAPIFAVSFSLVCACACIIKQMAERYWSGESYLCFIGYHWIYKQWGQREELRSDRPV